MLGTILLQQPLRDILLPHESLRDLLGPLVLVPAQLLQMHLIRPICQSQRADVGPHVRQRRILTDTRSAEALHGAVNDRECHLWHENLGLGDLLEGSLGIERVNLDGGVEDDKACGIYLDAGLGHPLDDDAVFFELLAKGRFLGVVDPHEHPLESFFRLLASQYEQRSYEERDTDRTNGSHGVVDTSRAETTLDDLETSTLTQHYVLCRHPDVLERQVAMTVGRVIVAIDRHHPFDGDTWSIGRDQNDRLLPVHILVVLVRLTHHDIDLTSGISSTTAPPFLQRVSSRRRQLNHGGRDVPGRSAHTRHPPS